jgi:hypothetical protein
VDEGKVSVGVQLQPVAVHGNALHSNLWVCTRWRINRRAQQVRQEMRSDNAAPQHQ